MIGIGIVFYLSSFFPGKIRSRSLFMITVSCVIALLFIITISRPALNPVVYSIQDEIQNLISKPKSDAKINKLAAPVATDQYNSSFNFLNKGFDLDTLPEMNYDRVVVLVMEGINYDDYIRASSEISGSFYEKRNDQCVVYTNYHTLNLDSYTSLIAILNSIFVPYQAYADEEKYSFVNKRTNLVRFFNRNGYSTFFLTSYGKQQLRFVPDLKEWDRIIVEDNIKDNKEFACVSTNKVESACEDFAVFDDLMNLLKNNPKSFIFQEMVYGHTSQWIEKTGLKTVEYYNKYFDALFDELELSGLLDDTLIVIVSDHGPRINATEQRHYKVPLMLCASNIDHSINNSFLSHLDFKGLLLKKVSRFKYSENSEKIFVTGNSGELIYGKITADQKYIFINNRNLAVHTNTTSEKVQQLNNNYQNYLHYFEGLKLKN